MQLFVQLAGPDTPQPTAALLGRNVLQLFYCTSETPHCEVECEAFFPHSRSTLLRLLPIDEVGAGASDEGPSVFPTKRIVGWTPARDFPGWEELRALGVELSDDDAEVLDLAGLPQPGEKLGGWPLWVQGVEYPNCRLCGRRMELILQLDSGQTIPYDFGDAGVGHNTQCPDHLSELAFGWACS